MFFFFLSSLKNLTLKSDAGDFSCEQIIMTYNINKYLTER